MLVANKSMSIFKTSHKNLNIQGNGLPLTNHSAQQKLSECSLTAGQLPYIQSKKTYLRNDKRESLPTVYQQWKQCQRSENISDISLCPSTSLSYEVSASKCSSVGKNPIYSRHYKAVVNKDCYPTKDIDLHSGQNKCFSETNGCYNSATFLLPIQQKQITIPPAHVNTLNVVLNGKKMEMEERLGLMRGNRLLKQQIFQDYTHNLFPGKGFNLLQPQGTFKSRGKMLLEEEKELFQSPTKPPLKKPFDIEIKSHKQPSRSILPPLDRHHTLLEAPRNKNNDISLGGDIHGNLMNSMSLSSDKSKNFLSADIKDGPEVESKESTASTFLDLQILKELGQGNEAIPVPKSETKTSQEEQQLQQQQDPLQEENQDQQQSDISLSWTLTDIGDINSGEKDVLKKTFNRLDTDKDGHILYTQLKSQLPEKFSTSQEKFIKVVYDITSQNTFFGLMEFIAMIQLTKAIEELSDSAIEAFNLLNFTHLQQDLLEYFIKFKSGDSDCKGSISLDSLSQLISVELGSDHQMEPLIWNHIVENISLTDATNIKKTNFLAHIPYFLSLKNKSK
ncbi:uncharacterized protein LOC106877675 isoform X2 [Octopus bimaculoides]|uniref:uncharacterized protein LOC106877675 isoform X2 n=1 Tax=Octopus bimaculoides TaxID=37653 RepID=UPI0022E43982|nr:uncharacterized protein LOC106877675 isoform X2 [Octopus bimaculoides]